MSAVSRHPARRSRSREPRSCARVEHVLGALGDSEVPSRSIHIRQSVAARAIELGAVLVNDVVGLQKDPAMAEAVAAAEAAS